MAKINEYPQAATINNNDLFVIDQQSGGDHATKSASVSQIADKVTDGLTADDIPLTSSDPTPTATAIGDLSALTTSVTSSLVGAVNSLKIKKIQCGTVNMDSTTKAVTLTGFTSTPFISVTCVSYYKEVYITGASSAGFTINTNSTGTFIQYIAVEYAS